MSDSPAIQTYQRRVFYRAASNRLQEAQEVREDFVALKDVYEKALESQEWCYGNQHWDMVLDFMRVLKDFLHLQGYLRKAEDLSLYAIEAAKQLQQDQADWVFYAGLMQDEQGKYQEAERYYQPGLAIAQTEKNITLQAEIMRRWGWVAHAQGKRGIAKERYDEAIALHNRAGDDLGEARSWRHLALLAIDAGCYQDAQNHLQKSLSLAKGHTTREAQRVQAGVLLDLGRIAWNQGRLAEAKEHLGQALAYSRQAQDQLLEADIQFQIEILAEAHKKDFAEAAKPYLKRLRLAEAANDRRAQATALIALGNLALQHAKYDKAKEYYERLAKFDDRLNKARAMAQLGTLAYQEKDYQQAAADLTEALTIFSQLERPQEQAICHHQLGLVAQAMNLWSEAETHFQRSLAIRQDLGLLNEVFSSVYHLGRLAQQQGFRETAIRYYQEALAIGEQAAINPANLDPIRQVLEKLKALRDRNSGVRS